MRFAYADPPYLGKCGKHYRHNHADGRCYDRVASHVALLGSLVDGYPDGWVLSLSVPTLRHLLPLTPERTRVCAWVKPFAAYKPGVRPCYAWEPLLLFGGRGNSGGYDKPEGGFTPKDWFAVPAAHGPGRSLGLTGAKPLPLLRWIADLLGYQPDRDSLDDIFPGTGNLGRVLAQGVIL